MFWKIQENIQVKNTQNTLNKYEYNSEKANNAKYSKTKLSRFSRLLRHSVKKRDGLSYNASEHTRGAYFKAGIILDYFSHCE